MSNTRHSNISINDGNANGEENPILYPLSFPIKVMGINHAELEPAVAAIAKRHDPAFDAGTIERRESKEGKYLSLTITIWATSRAQLDALYTELTGHEWIKYVL